MIEAAKIGLELPETVSPTRLKITAALMRAGGVSITTGRRGCTRR